MHFNWLILLLIPLPFDPIAASDHPVLRQGSCSSDRGLLDVALDPFKTAFLGGGEEATSVEYGNVSYSTDVSTATFAQFEAGILHIPRADDMYFSRLELSSRSLLSMLGQSVSLEKGLEGAPLAHGPSKDFQLVKRVKGKDGEWWSGSVPASEMSAPEVVAWLRKGFTLIFNSVDCRFPKLAHLAEGLENELGFVVQMNAYLSPRNSQGFEVHWDPMETLVLQLEGNKTWSIYEPIIDLPQPAQRYKPKAAEIDASSRRVVTLSPGSTLYLPRGWLHEASTNTSSQNIVQRVAGSELLRLAHRHGSASLHLTVGIEAEHHTWVHVLHRLVTLLVKQSLVAIILHLALHDTAREVVALRASLRAAGRSCASAFDALSARPDRLSLDAAMRALHTFQQSPSTKISALIFGVLPPDIDAGSSDDEIDGESKPGSAGQWGDFDDGKVRDPSVAEVASVLAAQGDATMSKALAKARAAVLDQGRSRCQEAVDQIWRCVRA